MEDNGETNIFAANFNLFYMTKENPGVDFKSTTDAENKKLFIETYGCQMNVADSEVIASVMKMAGYDVCDKLEIGRAHV